MKIHLFFKLSVLIIAASATGCSTIGAWNFEADSRSSQPIGDVKLLLPMKTKGSNAEPVELVGFEKAVQAYKNSCAPGPQQEMVPLVSALLPVVGEMLFGFAVDHAARKLDEIKEASEASYAARLPLTAGRLRAMAKDNDCLVVLRYAPVSGEGKPELSMAGILKLSSVSETAPGAVAMQPVYVGLMKSAALRFPPRKRISSKLKA